MKSTLRNAFLGAVSVIAGCSAEEPSCALPQRAYGDELALLGRFVGAVDGAGVLSFTFEASDSLAAMAAEQGVAVEELTQLLQGSGGGRGENPVSTYELVTCRSTTVPGCGPTYADPSGSAYPIIEPGVYAGASAACGTIGAGRATSCYAGDVELRTFYGVEISNVYVRFTTTTLTSTGATNVVFPYGGATGGVLGLPASVNNTVYRYGTLEPAPATINLDGPYHQASLRRWRFSFPAGTTDISFTFAGNVYGTVATAAHAPAQSSVTPTGDASSYVATAGCLANNGDFQVFSTTATGTEQVYLAHRRTGDVTLVSVNNAGAPANAASTNPCVTPNGRYVVFESTARNLGADADSQSDIFVRDVVANTTRWVSTNGRAGAQCGASQSSGSYSGTLSDDARYVAFHSTCGSFCGASTNCSPGRSQVYVRDLTGTALTQVSLRDQTTHTLGSSDSAFASISADGRFATFESAAGGSRGWLAPDATDTTNTDVFVRDLAANRTYRLSNDRGTSRFARISRTGGNAHGHFVAFYTTSSTIVSGFSDTNAAADVLRCRGDGTECTYVSLVHGSTTAIGNATSGGVNGLAISDDGSMVAFETSASNLFASDTNGATDVVVRTIATNATRVLSLNGAGALGGLASTRPSFAPTRDYVMFQSNALNLQLDTGCGAGSFDGSDGSTRGDVFSIRL
jgi:hypothetical protein